ncbi:TPA: hypothetical protein ACH3X1_003275 [Trebouxia sp. C0004]
MIPQLYSPAKGRRCSESCLDLLAIQLVRYYQKQNLAPAAASIEAIGDCLQSTVKWLLANLPAILVADKSIHPIGALLKVSELDVNWLSDIHKTGPDLASTWT